MEIIHLPPLWYVRLLGEKGQGKDGTMRIPGTLDESEIGFPETRAQAWHPDAHIRENTEGEGITTRLTRRWTYEGPALLRCDMLWSRPDDCRVYLDVERARCLKVRVNGREAPAVRPFSLSAPQSFEITEMARGLDRFEIESDNSYPGLPHDDLVFSSAATDETQTNWNGLLGEVCLRLENPVFLESVRVYPKGQTLDVAVTVQAARPFETILSMQCDALRETATLPVSLKEGCETFCLRGLVLRDDVRRWDLDEGQLYTLTVAGDGLDTMTASFGVRDFGKEDGHFTLNGRRIHLRCEANCAVFPETGYAPMDEESWKRILQTYRAYGVNCMRFHSHVPPEAAFAAADRMGMLMQPELPCWNPRNAFEDDVRYATYVTELRRVLEMLANHPSFVMLTFGNELHAGELGHRRMDEMLQLCRDMDATRLYANASNPHYGSLGCDPRSDFYTSQRFEKLPLRGSFSGMHGHVNEARPGERTNYDAAMAALRKTYADPVISFEVGQYEVLPDFDELTAFRGVTRPDNLIAVQRRALAAGMAEDWKRRVEATGELALLCYREEMEANLRTEDIAGISLLGLQDFPGQGTALVGMLNSHLVPKPFSFADPSRFRAFFRDVLPLTELEKYTYVPGEGVHADVRLANYGKTDLKGALSWTLEGRGVRLEGQGADVKAGQGRLSRIGEMDFTMPTIRTNEALRLTVRFADAENVYTLWLYGQADPVRPESVYETQTLDGKTLQVLSEGGRVYLSPPSTSEALPKSIQAQFSTDFWSVGTFPQQEGGMGQLIDSTHPLFASFPTAFHSDWQWWPMARQRAVILRRHRKAIISELDSYATMRSMAKLLECRVGPGRLMFSSMGLQDLQAYPEARALQQAIYDYMNSETFQPGEEMDLEELSSLVWKGET